MSFTLRVLDGADRGRVFNDLEAPITIGREEGNSIQLNDERVSRYHVKIQEDHDRLVLTDLDSTNGTKVNGEDMQLRILRFGDMISMGRSVLLFGSRDQIAERLARLRHTDRDEEPTMAPEDLAKAGDLAKPDVEVKYGEDSELQATLYSLDPPELPERLTPGQAAQLSELLEYLHLRVRNLLSSVRIEPRSEQVKIDFKNWQYLVDLQARLAEYLRSISEPKR
jgi:pSer/pThr/pTyr-binding forkhead associated (FHA) protein